jgi:hypothetical protein
VSACRRCRESGKTWSGSDARCGFADGLFHADNWNCATLNELRSRAEEREAYSEDQYAALLPWDGAFLVLGWYKRRGRTEFAGLLHESTAEPLTLTGAEAYLDGVARWRVGGEE